MDLQQFHKLLKLLKMPSGTDVTHNPSLGILSAKWSKKGGHGGDKIIARVKETARVMGFKDIERTREASPSGQSINTSEGLENDEGIRITCFNRYGVVASENRFEISIKGPLDTGDKMSEALCRQVRLVSDNDRETIAEARFRSQQRLGFLISHLTETHVIDLDTKKLHREMLKEAQKLERLMILEGVSDKDFFQLQKNFRSMVRASSVVSSWLKGTEVADKMNMWKTQGIELLNSLYEHIKQLEAGVDAKVMGKGLDKNMAKQRDQFVKIFTDFAILFRGMMALGDVFADEPATVGGYTDVKDIIMTMEREEYTDIPIGQALGLYDSHTGASMQKGLLGKKKGGMTGKFKSAIAKAISGHSPGFAKLASIENIVDAVMKKSTDQLMAIFGRFNSFVANDVDVEYLLSVTKNPRGLGAMFKGVFDAISSAGAMKMMH